MNNSINWTGNRVLDPNSPRQMQQPASPMMQNQMTQPAQTMPTRQMPPPAMPMTPITQGGAITQQGPPPSTEKGYIPNYLAANIGRNVRAEFIIGTTQYVDKSGVISEVGINYFVLHDPYAGTDVMCDLYSVKFVTILSPQSPPMFPPA